MSKYHFNSIYKNDETESTGLLFIKVYNKQTFVAVGKIIDDKAYQVEQFEGFFPFRRNVEYYQPVKDCSIEIARQHPEWKDYTSRLRYGHFEVSKDFFLYIFHYMKVDDEV